MDWDRLSAFVSCYTGTKWSFGRGCYTLLAYMSSKTYSSLQGETRRHRLPSVRITDLQALSLLYTRSSLHTIRLTYTGPSMYSEADFTSRVSTQQPQARPGASSYTGGWILRYRNGMLKHPLALLAMARICLVSNICGR